MVLKKKDRDIKYYTVNKMGYILKESSLEQSKLEDLVNNDTKVDIQEIYSLLYNTSEEICDLIKTENNLDLLHNLSVGLHIETLIGNLSYELLELLNPLVLKIYRGFLVRLAESEDFDNPKEAKELFNSFKLPDSEVYDKMRNWLYNLETWILDNINLLLDETQNNINKSFFSNIANHIKELFNRVKTKIDNFISYTISTIKTKAEKLILDIHGIEKYEIIESGNSNCCKHCQDMAGEIYDVDALQIGENAPPFHPHCDCRIKGRRTVANVDEPMVLNENLENYDRDSAINYAINWYNKYNPNYPNFSSKGDCANFVSQCLETGGFKMNEYWHCYPKNPKEVNPLYHLIDRFNNWNCTPAWSAAKDQYEYLKNSNIVIGEIILNSTKNITSAINDSEKPVKVGDIMYLQWDKDYPHHATIISKIENDMIFYAAHTNSQEKKPLSEFFDNNKNGIAYILKIK